MRMVLAAFAGVVLAVAAPAAARDFMPLPANTIDCHDFTHNGDGSWTAHSDAKPFDLGDTKGAVVRDETFSPDMKVVGDYDLADALDLKCAGQH